MCLNQAPHGQELQINCGLGFNTKWSKAKRLKGRALLLALPAHSQQALGVVLAANTEDTALAPTGSGPGAAPRTRRKGLLVGFQLNRHDPEHKTLFILYQRRCVLSL